MATEEIARLEQQIAELSTKLHQLHSEIPGKEVKNYNFENRRWSCHIAGVVCWQGQTVGNS